MFPLGLINKTVQLTEVFNLNTTTNTFYDNQGRHTVQTGSGITSVGGKATFTAGNGGVVAFNNGINADNDFVVDTTLRDFDVTFNFRMTADPDTLSLLFGFGGDQGGVGSSLFCFIGQTGSDLKVSVSAGGISPIMRHSKIQLVGDPEQSVIVSRRGLTYTITIDGVSVSVVATVPPTAVVPSNLLIGAWPNQNAIWDFVGTISNFKVYRA